MPTTWQLAIPKPPPPVYPNPAYPNAALILPPAHMLANPALPQEEPLPEIGWLEPKEEEEEPEAETPEEETSWGSSGWCAKVHRFLSCFKFRKYQRILVHFNYLYCGSTIFKWKKAPAANPKGTQRHPTHSF